MPNLKPLVAILIKTNSLQMTCSFFTKRKKKTADSGAMQLVVMCVLILFEVN